MRTYFSSNIDSFIIRMSLILFVLTCDLKEEPSFQSIVQPFVESNVGSILRGVNYACYLPKRHNIFVNSSKWIWVVIR